MSCDCASYCDFIHAIFSYICGFIPVAAMFGIYFMFIYHDFLKFMDVCFYVYSSRHIFFWMLVFSYNVSNGF